MAESWYIYTKKADFEGIAACYGIDPVIARILRNRDIVGEEKLSYFFDAGIDDLYDERLLPDLEKAAAAVWEAVSSGQKIRIVGDYDIDGICATYILFDGLRRLSAEVDYRIPERIRDGYGINLNIIEEAHRDGVRLLLSCDNGIAAIEEFRRAYELSMKAVVTDHHDVRKDERGQDILPRVEAVVDAKRSSSLYPTGEICGAVTAWKLLKAIFELAGRESDEWLRYLEFAALATVGDIMELKGENRIIVKEGLRIMSREPVNLGLEALIEELSLRGRPLNTYHIGFVIGPCINAGGRLETADSVMKLFLSEDFEEAGALASHLKKLNEDRKYMTEKGVKQGIAAVEEGLSGDQVLVVYIPSLHESLAGIVAGRLKEKYGKPCFVITDAADGLKGSGRSIEAYNMFEALCAEDGLLTKYGGHPMAAGLAFERGMLPKLREELNAGAHLKEEDFLRKIWIDVCMPLHYVTKKLIGELERLEPFGEGFRKPVFAVKGVRVDDMRVLGKTRNTLKFTLIDGEERRFTGIMFGDAQRLSGEISSMDELDILYYPEINTFRGIESIEIHVESFRKAR